MIKTTRSGAIARLVLTAVVGFFGTIALLLEGHADLTWAAVFAPLILIKATVASVYTVERFMNMSWAQANENDNASTLVGTLGNSDLLHAYSSDGAAIPPILSAVFKSLDSPSSAAAVAGVLKVASDYHTNNALNMTKQLSRSSISSAAPSSFLGTDTSIFAASPQKLSTPTLPVTDGGDLVIAKSAENVSS